MPDLNETRAQLELAFINGWGGTTPIDYDNVVYDPENDGSYVKAKVEFTLSENVNVGAALAGTIRQRHHGLFITNIYVPLNGGTGAAYDYADTYKGIMDNKNPVPNIFTLTSNVRPSGEQVDGYWSLVCMTEFYSDEMA